jgi:hypothetical protein
VNSEKVKELTQTLESLKSQELKLATQSENRDGLLFKIKRTIQNLENTPVDQRREVYANLIQFAELYPTKIRLGVYAPTEPSGGTQTLETKKAAGEFPAAVSNFGSVSNRKGSWTVLNGA